MISYPVSTKPRREDKLTAVGTGFMLPRQIPASAWPRTAKGEIDRRSVSLCAGSL